MLSMFRSLGIRCYGGGDDMSRRRGRAEPEGTVAEGHENSPVRRKSARLAEKIPKVASVSARGAVVRTNSNSRGGSRKSRGRSIVSHIEKEDQDVEMEEREPVPEKMAENGQTAAKGSVEFFDAMHVEVAVEAMESDEERENCDKKEAVKDVDGPEEDLEHDWVPDLHNGLCAYMKLLDRIVRIPEPERALYSKQGLDFLKLGDTMHDFKQQLDGETVTKAEVTLATTLIHTNQLLKVSHSPMFMDSILRWEPITEREIAYLIYMLARIKCPQINPECFARVEALLHKYTPNSEWHAVWNVLKRIEIPNLYKKDYKGKGPLFEMSDYFSENMFPSEGTTYMNTIYFLMVFKERYESGALVF